MILNKTSKAYNTEVLKERTTDLELEDKITKAVYYDLYTSILSEAILSRLAALLYKVIKYENSK